MSSESECLTNLLLTLPDEVLAQVLFYCSVMDVGRLEQTCRQLRKVCQSRGLWIKLLQESPIRQYPHLPPNVSLDALDTSGVKALVKRAIAKDQAWSYSSRPIDVNVKTLHFPKKSDAQEGFEEPRVLPGGKHILLLMDSQLQLWTLEPQKCNWVAPRSVGHETCLAFNFEVIDDGRKIRVATVDVDLESRNNVTQMRIITIDLESLTHIVEFENLVPLIFLFRWELKGDFVLCPTLPDESRAMLLNWKTREKLLLTINDTVMEVALRPRAYLLASSCVVFILKLRQTGFSAVVFPLSTFSKWFSITTEWDFPSWLDSEVSLATTDEDAVIISLPFSTTDSGPEAVDTVLTTQTTYPVMLATRAFDAAWLPQNPAEIIVAAFDGSNNEIDSTQLYSYHLQIIPRDHSRPSRSQKPRMSLVAHKTLKASKLPWNPRSISNDGHMFFMADKIRCFSLFDEQDQPVKEIAFPRNIFHPKQCAGPVLSVTEPWSGDILIWFDDLAKIIHIELERPHTSVT